MEKQLVLGDSKRLTKEELVALVVNRLDSILEKYKEEFAQ